MDDKEFDFGLIDSFDRLSDGSAHTRATPEQIAQSWKDDFSDPSKHDPNNFTYLVHGLQDETSRLIQRLAILQHAKGGDPTQDIDLLQNPMRISDKKIVSCSVIDQEHRETFGAVGLIVSTPAENVLRVASQDVGSNFFDPDAELSKGKRNLCTVAELLRSTSSQIYNEALLKGKTEQGEVQVKGFFVKVFEDGEPENPQMAQTIRLLSMRHGLPLISIVKKTEKYADKPAEIADDYITREPVFMAIQRGGLRYLISFTKDNFWIIDGKKRIRAMSRKEMQDAKALIESELSPEDKEKIRPQLDQVEARFDQYELKTHRKY